MRKRRPTQQLVNMRLKADNARLRADLGRAPTPGDVFSLEEVESLLEELHVLTHELTLAKHDRDHARRCAEDKETGGEWVQPRLQVEQASDGWSPSGWEV